MRVLSTAVCAFACVVLSALGADVADAAGVGGPAKKAAGIRGLKGRTKVYNPNAPKVVARKAGGNGTGNGTVGNGTAGAGDDEDQEPPKLRVSKVADFCVDFKKNKAPGTFKSPRPVGAVEFARYSRQLAAAKPTFILTAQWEAQIAPNRLLGETHGYHCVGCEHPLSRTWMLPSVKRRSLLNYAQGKPFRRLAGCLREVNDKCTMFCYEWGVRDNVGNSTRDVTDYRSDVSLNPNKNVTSPFPEGPRPDGSVPEYTAQPPKPDNTPLVYHRSYLEPGQELDTLNNVMINACNCQCETTNSSLAASRPYTCGCSCPPQHGDRGEEGGAGYAGPVGKRGPGGRRGERGPVGFEGNLAKGKHDLEVCDCFHKDIRALSGGKALLECGKDGYLIQGIKKTKGCGGLQCLTWLKCCRPCLKVKGVAPPTAEIAFETRYTDKGSKVGDGAAHFQDVFRRGGKLNGYCSGALDKISKFTNRKYCTGRSLAGVDHDIIYYFSITFTPHVNHQWRVRVGGDYGRGAILLLNGKIWANRAGENLNWGGRFDSSQVVQSAKTTLAPFKKHTVEFYGIEGVGDSEQTMEVDFGMGWMVVDPGVIDMGCSH